MHHVTSTIRFRTLAETQNSLNYSGAFPNSLTVWDFRIRRLTVRSRFTGEFAILRWGQAGKPDVRGPAKQLPRR